MKADQPWPPDSNGVYVVSEQPWNGIPTKEAVILYVGGNTGQSPLFVVRVGSLIADMLSFYTKDFGHHSGGQSLWTYCDKNRRHPLDLYLGWVEGVPCPRCAENEVHHALEPSLAKNVPASCKVHSPALRVCLPAALA